MEKTDKGEENISKTEAKLTKNKGLRDIVNMLNTKYSRTIKLVK
jgi:hypothetical protein